MINIRERTANQIVAISACRGQFLLGLRVTNAKQLTEIDAAIFRPKYLRDTFRPRVYKSTSTPTCPLTVIIRRNRNPDRRARDRPPR